MTGLRNLTKNSSVVKKGTPWTQYLESLEPGQVPKLLGVGSSADFDHAFGSRRVRRLKIEAAIYAMMDSVLMFQEVDNLLDRKIDRSSLFNVQGSLGGFNNEVLQNLRKGLRRCDIIGESIPFKDYLERASFISQVRFRSHAGDTGKTYRALSTKQSVKSNTPQGDSQAISNSYSQIVTLLRNVLMSSNPPGPKTFNLILKQMEINGLPFLAKRFLLPLFKFGGVPVNHTTFAILIELASDYGNLAMFSSMEEAFLAETMLSLKQGQQRLRKSYFGTSSAPKKSVTIYCSLLKGYTKFKFPDSSIDRLLSEIDIGEAVPTKKLLGLVLDLAESRKKETWIQWVAEMILDSYSSDPLELRKGKRISDIDDDFIARTIESAQSCGLQHIAARLVGTTSSGIV